MEDVNHKYPKTTIPNTMIAVVMIPATFFFLTNAIAVMIISSTYTIANQAVNPICNTSSNPDLPISSMLMISELRNKRHQKTMYGGKLPPYGYSS